METNDLTNKFIESLLRMKRDTICQLNLNIYPSNGLRLYLDKNFDMSIKYTPSIGAWVLCPRAEARIIWNPTLHEIVELLKKYDSNIIIENIQKMYDEIELNYDTINSITLFEKFKTILNLMYFEENHFITEFWIKLSVKNKLNSKNENDECLIYLDLNTNKIMYNIKKFEKELDDKSLMLILQNTNYNITIKALNEFYSKLKRRK